MKIIFSDIDGTLVHSTGGKDCIKIEGEDRFIHRKTMDLIGQIRDKGILFGIITGRRKSRYHLISDVIPHDFATIEHGCLLVSENGFDMDWAEILKGTIGDLELRGGPIWDYEKELNDKGIKTDSQGRYASFRVLKEMDIDILKEEGRKYGLTATLNSGMLDVLPIKGGKSNLIEFYLDKKNLSKADAVVIGDDINDLPMMELIDNLYCPANSIPEIKEIVKEKKGFISKSSGHEGTIEILKELLTHLI